MHFTFGHPLALLLVLLIPCFWICRVTPKPYYFAPHHLLGKGWRMPLHTLWLKALIFTLLVVALADPFVYEGKTAPWRKGRDLVLVLDASGSMGQSGFSQSSPDQSRYDVVLELANAFIKARHDDNIGVVVFGSFAYTAAALTYDLQALRFLLNTTSVGIAGESTAIGDALMQALRTLSFGQAKSKVVVLLTDGKHNAGSTSPKEAVQQAQKAGVKLYTIGIGAKQDYDATLLQKIAQATGGRHFHATQAKALQEAFNAIEQLESSTIRAAHYLHPTRLFWLPLSVAMLLLLLWTLFLERGRL